MINAAYGKTMDWLVIMLNIIKNMQQTKLCFTKIFSKDLVAIHEIIPVLTLDKPIYTGFSVLDVSKIFKYGFHYNYIKKIDGELFFADTDILTYEVKTEDIYEDFYNDKDLFAFSNYPEYSKFFYPSNRTEIG